MPGAGADALAHALLDRADAVGVVEERDVLLPGNPDHHVQVVLKGEVEEPARRHRAGPDGVQARGGHLLEVARHGPLVSVLATRSSGRNVPYVTPRT